MWRESAAFCQSNLSLTLAQSKRLMSIWMMTHQQSFVTTIQHETDYNIRMKIISYRTSITSTLINNQHFFHQRYKRSHLYRWLDSRQIIWQPRLPLAVSSSSLVHNALIPLFIIVFLSSSSSSNPPSSCLEPSAVWFCALLVSIIPYDSGRLQLECAIVHFNTATRYVNRQITLLTQATTHLLWYTTQENNNNNSRVSYISLLSHILSHHCTPLSLSRCPPLLHFS
jgi:hypothetical protein